MNPEALGRKRVVLLKLQSVLVEPDPVRVELQLVLAELE